jgi:hypothetical protein
MMAMENMYSKITIILSFWFHSVYLYYTNNIPGSEFLRELMLTDVIAGPYSSDFFHQGGSIRPDYMPKKVPNIQRIINNDILKIVNIVFSGGGGSYPRPPAPRCVRPCFMAQYNIIQCDFVIYSQI